MLKDDEYEHSVGESWEWLFFATDVAYAIFLIVLVVLIILVLAMPASAQWLSEPIQQHERRLWDMTGVEFPKGMKWFSLPAVSQRLVVINGQDRFGIYSASEGGDSNVNQQFPWKTPAGLHWSPTEQWRKVSGAVFPGPIKVYFRQVQPSNSPVGRPQSQIAWTFPDGTIFAEMLVRRYRGLEWPFEIRMRKKDGGKWDEGMTARPFANVDNLPSGSTKHEFNIPAGGLANFGLSNSPLTVWKLPPRSLALSEWDRLTPTRLTVAASDNDSALPREFFGTTRRCSACHDQASSAVYGESSIRGSDSVFSWSPFVIDSSLNSDENPNLDGRWGFDLLIPHRIEPGGRDDSRSSVR